MAARTRLSKEAGAPVMTVAPEDPTPLVGTRGRLLTRDVARRQRVTLLVADIQASTELIQHMDPEDAAQALDPALTTMLEAVDYYQGVVSHVRGDGLLAVFGAPSACEDHALRACLAALAILGKGPPSLPTPLRVRIGIHSGEVVLRHVRYRKGESYEAVGVAAHIAARLEETAGPNSACLSDATMALVRGFIKAEPLEPTAVKGIDQPISRFQLISANPHASRWEVRSGNSLSPFFGRIGELAALAGLLANARNTLQVARILGPAGIGKSRLLHEFLSREVKEHCYVMRLAGDPHSPYVPLRPITLWVRHALDLRTSDATQEARLRFQRALSRREDLNRSDHDLLQRLLGLSSSRELDFELPEPLNEAQISQTLAKVVLHLAGKRQIVIACDDGSYFDQASRSLLSAVAERVAFHGVLLIITGRTSVRLPLTGRYPSKLLRLLPLSADEAGHLLASVSARAKRDRVVEADVLRKAGGNPLFLEEVGALISKEAGRPPGEQAELADPPVIPGRVEVLIADRLTRLPRRHRTLLQACAVIGVDVPLKLLAAFTETDESLLYERLQRLQSADLLYETRRYPDPQFSFKHSLIRDVAYGMMLKRERQQRHAWLVQILEGDPAATSDTYTDALCLHCIRAGLHEKAVTHLRQAAKLAIERSAYQFAERYLRHALEIVRALPNDRRICQLQIDLLLSIRGLVGSSGKYLEADRLLDEAEALVNQIGDEKRSAQVIALRVHLLNILGELDRGLLLAKQACGLARRSGDMPLLSLSLFGLGQTYFNRGEFRDAERAFAEIITQVAVLPARGDEVPYHVGTLVVNAQVNHALALALISDFPCAERSAASARALAAKTERPRDIAFGHFAEGFVRLQKRCGDTALVAFEEAMQLAEQNEMAQLVPPFAAGMGYALLLRGSPDRALDWLTRAYEAARRHNRHMMQSWAAAGLALAHLQARRDMAARRHSEEAAQVAAQFGFQGFLTIAERVRGLALAVARETASARKAINTALTLAEALGMRGEIAHCHTALSFIDRGKAVFHETEAARLYRELGMNRQVKRLEPLSPADRMIAA